MVKANLTVNNEQLRELVEQFPAEAIAALPNTIGSFNSAVEKVRNMWTDYLNGDESKLGIKSPDKVTASMIDSIKLRFNNPLSAEIYSYHKGLEAIQNGTPDVEYDMKKTHPYGRKSRVSKKGIPYLIIPFRWGTPTKSGTKAHSFFSGMIDTKIYNTNVKNLSMSYSRFNKIKYEKNALGEMIMRAGYDWGDRLESDNERMNGLVRMKDVRGSNYFTFRVISARSPQDKWWYRRKGTPGVDMIGALERAADKILNDTVKAGLEADERNLTR